MQVFELVEFIVFPGLFFILYMGIFSSWLVRKLAARIENRVGPPFNQPAYDILKLLAKERVYPAGTDRWVLHLMPRFQVSIAILMAFFIPIYKNEGLLSFDGDLYFFLFLLTLHGTTTFFIGWSSNNPYAVSGAGRAVMTEISLELPLAISLAGMAVMTGSMRISEISANVGSSIFTGSEWYSPTIYWLFLAPWVLLFVTAIYASLGALELAPFSAAHAETEIVGGWNTELTGSDLAMTKLADMINLFNLAALIVAIFFGGPIRDVLSVDGGLGSWAEGLVGFASFLIFFLTVVFIIAFVRTVSSRLRIDQITTALWSSFFPASMIGVFSVILVLKIGG